MSRGVNWAEEFPELDAPKESLDSLEHSLKKGIGKLLHKITNFNPTRKKRGFLPKMVVASKVSIGVWLVLSFCERDDSVVNQVVSKGSTLCVTSRL